jgi:hypothetical protein
MTAYPSAARYFYMVTFEIDPADEPLFNEIYETEHIPNIVKVPGVLGVVRFRDHAANEHGWLVYSALYYLERADIPDTEAWKTESDKGRWAPMIRPRIKSRQRRLGHLTDAA